MKVLCPSCKENLHVPDDHLRRGVAKVRCAHCGFGFVIRLGEPGSDSTNEEEDHLEMPKEGFKTSGKADAASGEIGEDGPKFVPTETMTSIRVDPKFQSEIKGAMDIIEEVGARAVEEEPPAREPASEQIEQAEVPPSREPEDNEAAADEVEQAESPSSSEPEDEADDPGPTSPFPPAGPTRPVVPHAAVPSRPADEETEETEETEEVEEVEQAEAPEQAPAEEEVAASEEVEQVKQAAAFDMKATQPMPLPPEPAAGDAGVDLSAATLPMGDEVAPVPEKKAPAGGEFPDEKTPILERPEGEEFPDDKTPILERPAAAPASKPAPAPALSPFSQPPAQRPPASGYRSRGIPPPGFGPSYENVIVAHPAQSRTIQVVGIIMTLVVLGTGLFFLFVIARNDWQLDISRFDVQVSRAFSVSAPTREKDELRALIVTPPVVDEVRFDSGERALLVRGTVKNNDTRTLRFVYVKAWLTRHGRRVTSGEAPAGNPFTVEQLTKLNKAKAMGQISPAGQSGGNSKLAGGEKLPYAVIITPLPGDYTADRYEVEAVASRAELYLGAQ